MGEHGSKVSDTDKKSIEDASTSLKDALKKEDIEDIKKKTEILVQASMKLGEAIYKSQQNTKQDTGKDGAKDNTNKKDDNVAEANKEEDKKKREGVDVRNQADTLIHSTEKNLKEHGSKVSDTDKKSIED